MPDILESGDSSLAAASMDAERLRELLDKPQPKDEAWQDQAARLVARLAIQFPLEPDSVRALRAACLIGAAQAHGVKEAKKRALKLTRWSEERPPTMRLLGRDDERTACVALLSKLDAPWAEDYIEEALVDTQTATVIVADLLRWARSLHPELSDFVSLYARWLQSAGSPERLLLILKEAPRLFKLGATQGSRSLAESFAALTSATLAGLGPASDTKPYSAGLLSLLALLQELAAKVPPVLVELPVVSAVGRLRPSADLPAAKKAVEPHLEGLGAATQSLLQAEVNRYGSAALAHWCPAMPVFRQAYPGWDARMSEAAQNLPALNQWVGSGESPAAGAQDNPYEHETVFAQLLPAWQQFLSEMPQVPQAHSLTDWITAAARLANVEYFGQPGEVIDFDPLEHRLADEAATPPRRVRLVRPGVLTRRTDGSIRVLVQAVVVSL